MCALSKRRTFHKKTHSTVLYTVSFRSYQHDRIDAQIKTQNGSSSVPRQWNKVDSREMFRIKQIYLIHRPKNRGTCVVHWKILTAPISIWKTDKHSHSQEQNVTCSVKIRSAQKQTLLYRISRPLHRVIQYGCARALRYTHCFVTPLCNFVCLFMLRQNTDAPHSVYSN